MGVILLALGILITSQADAAVKPVIVCIQCHIAQPTKFSQPVKLWETSIHAEHGVGCNACHGGDPMDSAQAMSPARGFRGVPIPTAIPALCGGCHVGVTKHYTDSAHGRTLGKGGPTCVTCHGSHDIQKASLDLISKKKCSTCHTPEKAWLIRSTMLKRDTMLNAIEKKIKTLRSQGVETDQLEKRLFSLRNRFHAMFHSLDIKLILQESEHIQAALEKTSGAGGVGTGPLTGVVAVGWALIAALLFYLIKKNLD
ncbi:MAG: cytochrome c3 family protein [Desulfobulbaceae bacterium]|nr:cytochrome c3 family protein [Desulfobulbaceae bacterium]HIJ90569.1 cytochrome C [Deltaproteobacteria bacterium]